MSLGACPVISTRFPTHCGSRQSRSSHMRLNRCPLAADAAAAVATPAVKSGCRMLRMTANRIGGQNLPMTRDAISATSLWNEAFHPRPRPRPSAVVSVSAPMTRQSTQRYRSARLGTKDFGSFGRLADNCRSSRPSHVSMFFATSVWCAVVAGPTHSQADKMKM